MGHSGRLDQGGGEIGKRGQHILIPVHKFIVKIFRTLRQSRCRRKVLQGPHSICLATPSESGLTSRGSGRWGGYLGRRELKITLADFIILPGISSRYFFFRKSVCKSSSHYATRNLVIVEKNSPKPSFKRRSCIYSKQKMICEFWFIRTHS